MKRTPHEQIDATAAAGYHYMSMSAHDLRGLDADGLGDLARYGRERSVTIAGAALFAPMRGGATSPRVVAIGTTTIASAISPKIAAIGTTTT